MAQSVARQIGDCGGEVVAHVDPNSRRRWVDAVSRLARRVGFPARPGAISTEAPARGAPKYHGWDVAAINGASAVESVTLQQVDEKWRPRARRKPRTLAADAVCIGYGLAPAAEMYQMLGARLGYAPALGGWAPVVDTSQRTDVLRLYGAGDSAGILGTAAAYNTGRMAALSAAFDLGRLDRASFEREMRIARRVQARAARAASALADLTRPRSSAMAWVPDATIVCRCESITAGELRAAIGEGAREINALKAATRCGMGPCGGRACEEAAAALLECARFSRERIGKLTARAPLRPLPLTALTGSFAYADIPFPRAADT
jgi:bacterioferritin-associated ferredoxin